MAISPRAQVPTMTARAPIDRKMANGTNGHSGGLATAPAKQTDGRAALLAKLRPLERLFGDCEWPERGVFLQARRRAREHALEVLDGGSCEDEARTALLVAATELFGTLGAARAVSPRQAADLVERLEDGLGVSRAELAREVLRAPELLSLPPAVAIEAQLGMLMAFAPLRSASLWRLEAAERINCAWHVGEGAQSRGAQQLARQLLAGQRRPPGGGRGLRGVAAPQGGQPRAAPLRGPHPGGGDPGRGVPSPALPL